MTGAPRLVRVKAFPGARRDELTAAGPDRFEIRVRAPAEGGRANAAVLAMLARHLGLPQARLRIVKGARERGKIVEVR